MKEILVFAGTTEGRKLSEYMASAGVCHTVCVATEYGEIVCSRHPLAAVRQGRMDQEEMEQFLIRGDFAAVIDATHPYAREVTRNIKQAVKGACLSGRDISYFRLKREQMRQADEAAQSGQPAAAAPIKIFQTQKECAQALLHTKGNILLTSGSRELAEYCIFKDLKKRLYVRVLPFAESISLCGAQGICGKQVIAMQGPFSVEMNEALIRQYQISYLVTKESGTSGGYREKLEAAKRTGTQVFVIGCRDAEEGYSFLELCRELEKLCGKKLLPDTPMEKQMEIILAGVGMGGECGMTLEVQREINEADILLGAQRILAHVPSKSEKHPIYQAQQVAAYVKELQQQNCFMEKKKIAVLFSGDSGFYSGCRPLYQALQSEIRGGSLKADVRILPGISSAAYLSSRIGESYQDAAVISMHGTKLLNLARRIAHSPKTFLLTSGVKDVNLLGKALLQAGMSDCAVTAGYQLSYAQQQIRTYTPAECLTLKEEGLYTCFIKNPQAAARRLTHGISDEAFIRDKVPMTKEEVRAVSICKLRLHQNAVVYDIGSGTGSIAVEIAGLSDDIIVYAVEQKAEAAALIEKNKEKFGLENIIVKTAAAPEGLAELPAATHAFIGGSGGRLKEIVSALYRINPKMRLVINAASIETVCEIKQILSSEWIQGAEIVQLQASRAKKTGNHHLLRAENPVWICAFAFAAGQEQA